MENHEQNTPPHPHSNLQHQLQKDYQISRQLGFLMDGSHYGCKETQYYASICQLLIEFLRRVVYIF